MLFFKLFFTFLSLVLSCTKEETIRSLDIRKQIRRSKTTQYPTPRKTQEKQKASTPSSLPFSGILRSTLLVVVCGEAVEQPTPRHPMGDTN